MRHRAAPSILAVAGLTLGPVLAACGGATAPPARATASAPPAACVAAADGEAATVARRVLREARVGPGAREARARVAGSRAVALAVARGDARAARRAAMPLLEHQIARLELLRGGRVLVRIGHAPALSPSRGRLARVGGRPVGTFVLAVGADAPVEAEIAAATGGPVARGADATASRTVLARAFPGGQALALALHPPAPAEATCAGNAAAVRTAVVRAVGLRVFHQEASGAAVRRRLAHVAGDPGFRAAVAARDPVALRAAIIRFFRDPTLHVVRVRAIDATGRLIGDVGGPWVMAPASAPVRSATGALLGRVTLSIQDDTGYMKLLRRFTGARVVLRGPGGTVVPGSDDPARVRGPRVVRYRVRGFPAMRVAVALLVRPPRPA